MIFKLLVCWLFQFFVYISIDSIMKYKIQNYYIVGKYSDFFIFDIIKVNIFGIEDIFVFCKLDG